MAVALDSMQWTPHANLGATYQYFQAWEPSIKSIQKALELYLTPPRFGHEN
jgi:hypothetical protein